ncbi:MAG: hypothetical protein ACYCWW_10005 [Deltaproteobacteria bacterium]
MVNRLAALATGLAALGAAGCYDVSGLQGTPSMLPGSNCMQCHSATGTAPQRTWTLAGTVYGDPKAATDAGLLDAEILVTDSSGQSLTLVADDVGNFYTGETLTPPLRVEAQWGDHRMRMDLPPPIGVSCNACHSDQPQAILQGYPPAPGRLFVPTSAPATSGAGH